MKKVLVANRKTWAWWWWWGQAWCWWCLSVFIYLCFYSFVFFVRPHELRPPFSNIFSLKESQPTLNTKPSKSCNFRYDMNFFIDLSNPYRTYGPPPPPAGWPAYCGDTKKLLWFCAKLSADVVRTVCRCCTSLLVVPKNYLGKQQFCNQGGGEARV